MLIKFLNVGTGDPGKAASYVLGEKDHQGNVRAGVQILRGDAVSFTALARSVPFQYCYTSAVIAWSPEDRVTDEQLHEVLDVFEEHAFAGLSSEQYHMTAVMHLEDDGSRHLHILVPRVELTSGKSLNIAPPGHHHYFDPLRDFFNYKYEWARPDDQKRSKEAKLSNHIHLQNAAAVKAGLKDEPKKTRVELINQFIEQRILYGVINNRQELLTSLSELGEITREGQTYISLKTDQATDRLRETYYHDGFSFSDYRENQTGTEAVKGTPGGNEKYSDRLKECISELKSVRTKRFEYNQKYYPVTYRGRGRAESQPTVSQEFEAAAQKNDSRRSAAGYGVDSFAVHEPAAVRRHQNSDEATEAAARNLSGRHDKEYRVNEQNTKQNEKQYRDSSTVISGTATRWLAKIAGNQDSMPENAVVHFDIRRVQHPLISKPFYISSGEQHARNSATPAENSNDMGTEERDFITSPTPSRISSNKAELVENARIAEKLSAEIAARNRVIAARIEQQKRDAAKLSTEIIKRNHIDRIRQYFSQFGARITHGLKQLFGRSQPSKTYTRGNTESNTTAYELTPTVGLNRLVKHTRRLFSTKITPAHLGRLQEYERQAQQTLELINQKLDRQAISMFLLKMQKQNSNLYLNLAIDEARSAEKYLTRLTAVNASIDDPIFSVRIYVQRVKNCLFYLEGELSKMDRYDLENMKGLCKVIEHQSEMLKSYKAVKRYPRVLIDCEVKEQIYMSINKLEKHISIRENELKRTAVHHHESLKSVFMKEVKQSKKDDGYDYDPF